MSGNVIEEIEFAGGHISLVREEQVQELLSLDDAIDDLRDALRAQARQQTVNRSRVRVETRRRGSAWLHTKRAGMANWNVAGGKDYTSIGFETPSMWATVVDTRVGLPLALIEANHLSRVGTAAITAIATDLLAPTAATCLAHFGAGKISQLLVRAVLKVRPSVQRICLVRHDFSKGVPDWLDQLGGGSVQVELSDASSALIGADLVTTATSSRIPVIPTKAEMPKARHINLIGSNHIKRREIDDDLARRCLPPGGYLVVEDTCQVRLEAGDFAALEQSGAFNWDDIPTVGHLLESEAEKQQARKANFTAFKSVGLGLTDLALATGVLRRLGLLTGPSSAYQDILPPA
jgi:ornithine cyclodeaminase/alanine dehydrogenase-like protein (mu-crystallin family)